MPLPYGQGFTQKTGGEVLLKRLAKSIREFKTASILSPLFVSLEVVFECLIPFIIAKLVSAIDVKRST